MQSTASISDPFSRSGLGSVFLDHLREKIIVLHLVGLNLSSVVELHVAKAESGQPNRRMALIEV